MDTLGSEHGRDDRAAVEKAISLLSSFANRATTGVGVSELARRAELSKSTAYRLLGMLERSGVVERVGTDYRLGQRLIDLGIQARSEEADRLREALTPFLADVYELTHETVHLASPEGVDVMYLAKLYGHHPVPSPSRVGARVPAHCTAVGKAMLAYDAALSEKALTAPLRALTASSLIDPVRLRAELAIVRQGGVAFDRQEAWVGLTCVAVPIFGPGGKPVAALSISGPTARFVPASHADALRRVGMAATRAVRHAGIGAAPARVAGLLASGTR